MADETPTPDPAAEGAETPKPPDPTEVLRADLEASKSEYAKLSGEVAGIRSTIEALIARTQEPAPAAGAQPEAPDNLSDVSDPEMARRILNLAVSRVRTEMEADRTPLQRKITDLETQIARENIARQLASVRANLIPGNPAMSEEMFRKVSPKIQEKLDRDHRLAWVPGGVETLFKAEIADELSERVAKSEGERAAKAAASRGLPPSGLGSRIPSLGDMKSADLLKAALKAANVTDDQFANHVRNLGR